MSAGSPASSRTELALVVSRHNDQTRRNLEARSQPRGRSERWLPALLLLFVGSGCAALIYEVVWFQLLQLSIGSSAVSLGVLLGIFMGGMCLGSLLLPRYLEPRQPSAARLRAPRARASACAALIVLFARAASRQRCTPRSPAPGRRSLVLRALVAGDLPASADAADGRDAAGHRALGRDDAAGRVVARLLLRRQPRRRGGRQPARRLLPAARLRHADAPPSWPWRSTSSWRCWRLGVAAAHAAHRHHATARRAGGAARADKRHGWCTSRSRCPG